MHLVKKSPLIQKETLNGPFFLKWVDIFLITAAVKLFEEKQLYNLFVKMAAHFFFFFKLHIFLTAV